MEEVKIVVVKLAKTKEESEKLHEFKLAGKSYYNHNAVSVIKYYTDREIAKREMGSCGSIDLFTENLKNLQTKEFYAVCEVDESCLIKKSIYYLDTRSVKTITPSEYMDAIGARRSKIKR